MAEVRFPKPSAWATFRLKTDLIDPPELKLELTRASKKERLSVLMGIGDYLEPKTGGPLPEEIMAMMERFVPVAMRHVTGWDLTLNGAPIPCTDEEKAKWLDPLLWEDAELLEDEPADESGEEPAKTAPWLWAKIIEFISERENFLKN